MLLLWLVFGVYVEENNKYRLARLAIDDVSALALARCWHMPDRPADWSTSYAEASNKPDPSHTELADRPVGSRLQREEEGG